MRNIALNQLYNFENREDKGKLLENFVYRRLREHYNIDSIRFWRTTRQLEIDFIVLTVPNRGKAIEVKMNCRSGKQYPLKKFHEQYKNFDIEIISYNIDKKCKWVLKL